MLRTVIKSRIWGKASTATKNKSYFHYSAALLKDPEVSFNDQFTTIKYPERTYSFNNTFLRDSSDSPGSIEASSGQKLFTTASIKGVKPANIEVVKEGIIIEWDDGDEATYTKEFLEKYSSPSDRYNGRYYDDHVKIWNKNNEERFPHLKGYNYNEYLHDDNVLKKVVQDLKSFGIAQIDNIPIRSDKEEDLDPSVAKIGERIGYLKSTFYDKVFDVRSSPHATNIAYTDKFLPLHQDLLYYESPPGLQLLHSIKSRAKGGESVFSDGFAAASYVKHTDSLAYQALLSVPINYHYNRDGHHYFHAHPLIEEGTNIYESHIYSGRDHFKVVNYSPPFQSPFDFGIMTNEATETDAKETGDSYVFEDFLRGFKLFEEYINNPKHKLEFKIEEGTCIIFDNRRILHARNAFDPQSGERWLKGTYLDKDTFESKLRFVKSEQH